MQEYGGRGSGGRPPRPWSWWSITGAVLALPGAALALLRLVPWDIGTPWIQLLSLFPAGLITTTAALAAAVVAVCLHRGTHRALIAVVVGALLVTQLGMILDRIMPAPGALDRMQSGRVQPAKVQSAAPPAEDVPGPVLTVMALNVGSTGVEPGALLAEIRKRHIDVLALPELAPAGLKELDKAGLASLLPARALDVDWVGIVGSGLFSRFPLEQVERVPGSAFHQSRAVTRIPAAGPVHLTAVHVSSPRRGHIPSWRAELRQLGELWQALPEDRHAILLGDFNASPDHREFRELLASGLTDAADVAGKGLTPTWPVNSPAPPFVAIDHILVSPGIEVSDFEVVTLPGTDHAAVVARLVLP